MSQQKLIDLIKGSDPYNSKVIMEKLNEMILAINKNTAIRRKERKKLTLIEGKEKGLT